MNRLWFWLAVEAMYLCHCRRIWWVSDTRERREVFAEFNLLSTYP